MKKIIIDGYDIMFHRFAQGLSNFFKKDKDKASPTSTKSPPEVGKKGSPEPVKRFSDKRSPSGELKSKSPEIRRRDTGDKETKTPEMDRRPTPVARVSTSQCPTLPQTTHWWLISW